MTPNSRWPWAVVLSLACAACAAPAPTKPGASSGFKETVTTVPQAAPNNHALAVTGVTPASGIGITVSIPQTGAPLIGYVPQEPDVVVRLAATDRSLGAVVAGYTVDFATTGGTVAQIPTDAVTLPPKLVVKNGPIEIKVPLVSKLLATLFTNGNRPASIVATIGFKSDGGLSVVGDDGKPVVATVPVSVSITSDLGATGTAAASAATAPAS